MARKLRIHYPGALYHVILRGNARQEIFFDDEDRYRFYLLVQEGVERFGHRAHAFCLMTNHIHLALQVGNAPLSRIMQTLPFRYTRWVNWRQKRSGHLFQGRYRAVLVNTNEYLLQLAGYIHLNPVRVRMEKNPADYPWSSHRPYLGKETIPWLTTETVLTEFGSNMSKARRLFNTFVNERINEGPREEFHRGEGCDGRILGEDTFVERVLRQAESEPMKKPEIDTIIEVVERLYNLKNGELAVAGQRIRIARARSMAAWAVIELSDAALTELAKKLGRDVTTLISSVTRLLERSRKDDCLAKEMERLREIIDKFATLQA